MLLDFFLERARIEIAADGAGYVGSVPDLPEIHVNAASFDECRERVARAIADLLESDARNGRATFGRPSNLFPDGPSPARADNDELHGLENTASTKYEEVNAAQGRRRTDFADILYEKRDWVARVTINRPDVYNAYTGDTLREMTRAFRDAALDRNVAALVLTGSGDRAFCTGGDVNQHGEEHVNHPDRARLWMRALVEAHEALRDVGKPTVARINGIVAGGGNGLNLACDLAIAADHAKFVLLETKFGMVAANGSAQWLPLVVGERRAREMLMTGEPVSANKALLWGLVNDVVPFKELDARVDSLCQSLIERFPECMKFTREQLSFWKNLSWDATIEQVGDWLTSHFTSPEAREGLQALAERREIDYRSFRLGAEYSSPPGDGPGLKETCADSRRGSRDCPTCGARDLSARFAYCGMCGAPLA
jgi:enoyl-CoA hydratase/carnithine racemase/predicted RNase H-like HicB family nuclease